MEITLQKVVLHIFFCQKVKTDIFQNGGGGILDLCINEHSK